MAGIVIDDFYRLNRKPMVRTRYPQRAFDMTTAAVTHTLLALEQERRRALVEEDFLRVAELFADDLVYVHTTGLVRCGEESIRGDGFATQVWTRGAEGLQISSFHGTHAPN
jgi:hypothetical protein